MVNDNHVDNYHREILASVYYGSIVNFTLISDAASRYKYKPAHDKNL